LIREEKGQKTGKEMSHKYTNSRN